MPEACPAGFVCMSLGLSIPIVLCPSGYYCGVGTRTLDPSNTDPLKPYPCPSKVFCLGGVAYNAVIDWIPTQPYGVLYGQDCSEGTFCKTGSYLSSGSSLCYRGHYCPPKTESPFRTPLGNFAFTTGSVAPTLCFPGLYAPLQAQVSCLPCPAGHLCQSYGTYKPSICPEGTYRSLLDSITCVSCPSGTYSRDVGAIDITQCLPCPKGRICSIGGMTTLNTSTACPEGYLCGFATNLASQFSHQSPGGFSVGIETVADNQYSNICPAGFYCPRGTKLSFQYSSRCQVGWYCPQSTSDKSAVEIKCPQYTTSITGVSGIQSCYIKDVQVCDKIDSDIVTPYQDIAYISNFKFQVLDDTKYNYTFVSSMGDAKPTGEVRSVTRIMPINETASSPYWQNETLEAYRACPSYGSGDGNVEVIIIGKNFYDTKLNYCKIRACISANNGMHPRRCKNQIKNQIGQDLLPIGDYSKTFSITRARFISPTRMACKVPEFLFDESVDTLASYESQKYKCIWTNILGESVPDNTWSGLYGGEIVTPGNGGGANWTYARPCFKQLGCPNLPSYGYEYFVSLTFPCRKDDIDANMCADKPEPGYMFNPCMSGEALIEVTNDGNRYSGGIKWFNNPTSYNDELNGVKILSTVQYDDPTIPQKFNFKNYTTTASVAIYTYVYPRFWYKNVDIINMEKAKCIQPLFSEEGPRDREQGWFLARAQTAAHIHVDFTHIPADMVYDQHYRIAVYAFPSRCTYELCINSIRVNPQESVPCKDPMKFSQWFQNPSIAKNIKNNITLYALDDLIFKVEVQILFGLYAPYQYLFQNTTIVRIIEPIRYIIFS